MRTLEQLLVRCEPPRIAAIAQLMGLDPLQGSRGEVAVALAQAMTEPSEMSAVWETLSEDERAAYEDLVASGEAIPWLTFTRRWGEVRTMGPARMERERPWEHPASPAEGLWYHGLVFRDVEEGPSGLVEVAVVPGELRAMSLSATPADLALIPIQPSTTVVTANDSLLDDCCSLLAYLQNHPVKLTLEGGFPVRDGEALARQLLDADPQRLDWILHLTTRLGWLHTESGKRVKPEADPVIEWLRAPGWEQRQVLALAWRDDAAWNDLWHVAGLQPDDTGSWHNDPVLARQAILRHLMPLPAGEWFALDDLVAAFKRVDPDFQRPSGDYSSWYIRDIASGEYLHGFESWDRVEGALIRHILVGPMAWLGLVDICFGADEGESLAFRITPGGTVLFGLATETEPDEPPPLSVRPDLTILVPAARRYERFQASRVADWVASGDTFVYRITAASLERARRQSIPVGRVIGFLQESSLGLLPRSAELALERWAEQGTEVHLERQVLLRVKDEPLLQRIAALPSLRRFVREIVGPRAALVSAADWPQLMRALVEEGFVPEVVGLEGEDAE